MPMKHDEKKVTTEASCLLRLPPTQTYQTLTCICSIEKKRILNLFHT